MGKTNTIYTKCSIFTSKVWNYYGIKILHQKYNFYNNTPSGWTHSHPKSLTGWQCKQSMTFCAKNFKILTQTNLELFINLIYKRLEEVKGILLFTNVDRVSPEFKHFPELLWLMILQSTVHQVTKHLLDLEVHSGKKKWVTAEQCDTVIYSLTSDFQ